MDLITRNHVAMKHLALARHIALKYWKLGCLRKLGELDDVLQESYIALLNALAKYDPGHARANLAAYLTKSIRRHLLYLNRTAGIVHVPVRVALLLTGESKGTAAPVLPALRGTISLSEAHARPAPDQPAEDRVFLQEVRGVVDSLPPTQREVIYRRFGLADGEGRTLQAIAEECGVTREAIRQRAEKALQGVRQQLKADGEPDDAGPPARSRDGPVLQPHQVEHQLQLN